MVFFVIKKRNSRKSSKKLVLEVLKWIIVSLRGDFSKKIWNQIQVFWWVAKKQAFESVIFATRLAGSGDFFRRGEGVNSEWDLIKAGDVVWLSASVKSMWGKETCVLHFWRRHCKIPNGFCQTPVRLCPTSSYRAWFMFVLFFTYPKLLTRLATS